MEAMTQTISQSKKFSSAPKAAQSAAIGLCSTCNSAQHCALRKKRGFDAICCEMFDDRSPEEDRKPDRLTSSTGKMSSDSRSSESEPLGLCVNCENRHTCTLARPEGGVWHCEEYL
jgi:hypothetical protein